MFPWQADQDQRPDWERPKAERKKERKQGRKKERNNKQRRKQRKKEKRKKECERGGVTKGRKWRVGERDSKGNLYDGWESKRRGQLTGKLRSLH